jgi:hypothetical protein
LPCGEDIDIACWILDATEAKRRLKATRKSLALVISHQIHRSVVRRVRRDRRQRFPAWGAGGRRSTRGWIIEEESGEPELSP